MINIGKTVVGFHGCDIHTYERIINGKETLKRSENDYDWLGNGVYFWENDQKRALEWAKSQVNRGKYKDAAVIGAIINLGSCLNLHTRECIELLKSSYGHLSQVIIKSKIKNTQVDAEGFSLLRKLDCAVIENIHNMLERENFSYDTVVGIFQEGGEVYPNAGFREKTHIQICVRNVNNILGYFDPVINPIYK